MPTHAARRLLKDTSEPSSGCTRWAAPGAPRHAATPPIQATWPSSSGSAARAAHGTGKSTSMRTPRGTHTLLNGHGNMAAQRTPSKTTPYPADAITTAGAPELGCRQAAMRDCGLPSSAGGISPSGGGGAFVRTAAVTKMTEMMRCRSSPQICRQELYRCWHPNVFIC